MRGWVLPWVVRRKENLGATSLQAGRRTKLLLLLQRFAATDTHCRRNCASKCTRVHSRLIFVAMTKRSLIFSR